MLAAVNYRLQKDAERSLTMNNEDMSVASAKRMIHNAVIALNRGLPSVAAEEDKARMDKILHGGNGGDYYDFLDELADMDLEDIPSEE